MHPGIRELWREFLQDPRMLKVGTTYLGLWTTSQQSCIWSKSRNYICHLTLNLGYISKEDRKENRAYLLTFSQGGGRIEPVLYADGVYPSHTRRNPTRCLNLSDARRMYQIGGKKQSWGLLCTKKASIRSPLYMLPHQRQTSKTSA